MHVVVSGTASRRRLFRKRRLPRCILPLDGAAIQAATDCHPWKTAACACVFTLAQAPFVGPQDVMESEDVSAEELLVSPLVLQIVEEKTRPRQFSRDEGQRRNGQQRDPRRPRAGMEPDRSQSGEEEEVEVLMQAGSVRVEKPDKRIEHLEEAQGESQVEGNG